MKKKEKYENFIYSFKKCFTWNEVQNFFIHKNKIFLWKCVSFFWIDFTNVLSILQKLKIANNLIVVLGYSNDKSIYCKEHHFDWLVDSLCKVRHVQPTGFNPYYHAVPS